MPHEILGPVAPPTLKRSGVPPPGLGVLIMFYVKSRGIICFVKNGTQCKNYMGGGGAGCMGEIQLSD